MTELDDDLLAKLVAGDLAPDSAQIRELWARRPELEARAQELLGLARGFEREGVDERRAIEAALAATTEADHAAVRASYFASHSTTREAHRARWFLVAAAALVALSAALYFLRDSRPDRGSQYLDTRKPIELVDPGRPLAPDVTLTWHLEGTESRPGHGQRWHIRFHTLGAVPDAGSLLFDELCDEARWTPKASDIAAWPAEVLWSVQLVDSDKAVQAGSPSLRLSVAH